MACYGTADTPIAAEMPAVLPTVTIDGSTYKYVHALNWEKRTGIIPAKAMIKVSPQTLDFNGNVTLNAQTLPFTKWSRVQIANGADTCFLGQLTVRRDRGSDNSIIWECDDDRILLSKIFVNGCLVWDPIDSVVKYISGATPRMNPGAMRNCRVVSIPALSVPIPVFTHLAEANAAWDDSDIDDIWTVGKLTDWTPSKALVYLWALTQLTPSSGIAGINAESWRSLANSARLQWLSPPSSWASDPYNSMAKKIPDTNFEGDTLALAIDKVLSYGAKWVPRIAYGWGSSGPISQLTFGLKDRSVDQSLVANPADGGQGITFPLLRNGPATDSRTCTDFHLDEDARPVCETVMLKGKRVTAESTWLFTQNAGDPLQKGWDATATDEGTEFQNIINGMGGDRIHARYPTKLPDYTLSQTWGTMTHANADGGLNADGVTRRPVAGINSDEAIALARSILQRPFRALQINPANLATIFAGVGGKYSDTTKYPYLKTPRPFLPRQSQYYLDDSLRQTRITLPMRIRVRDHGTTNWHEVGIHDVHCTPDGYLWLDGMTDERSSNGSDLLYVGSMYSPNFTLTLRDIQINAVIPLDVKKYIVADGSVGQIHPSMSGPNGDLGGGMMHYASGESWQEEHQILSEPSPVLTFLAGNPGAAVPSPISQILRDDDRTPQVGGNGRMTVAAKRRLTEKQWVIRKSGWKFPGLRLELDAGMYVDKIKMYGGQAGDVDYDVQAMIETIYFDCMQQETWVGGLVGTSMGRGAPAAQISGAPKVDPSPNKGGQFMGWSPPDDTPDNGPAHGNGGVGLASDMPGTAAGMQGTASAGYGPGSSLTDGLGSVLFDSKNPINQNLPTGLDAMKSGAEVAGSILNGNALGDSNLKGADQNLPQMGTPGFSDPIQAANAAGQSLDTLGQGVSALGDIITGKSGDWDGQNLPGHGWSGIKQGAGDLLDLMMGGGI